VDAPPHGDPMRQLVVLVIENAPDIRQMVSVVLALDGYAVLTASRGYDGLHEFHDQHPDLVVLDETLSDLSGWYVLARIRESSDLPVLLLTTPATDSNKLATLDSSNEDFLVKPFARAWLPDKLRALRVRRSWTPG
jgi:DNA-binding response OmpR family regulator